MDADFRDLKYEMERDFNDESIRAFIAHARRLFPQTPKLQQKGKKPFKEIKVPFDNGNLVKHVNISDLIPTHVTQAEHHRALEVDWVDNFYFYTALRFVQFEHKNSVYSIWDSIVDTSYQGTELEIYRRYPMFLNHMAEVIPEMVAGVLVGVFTFAKQGSSFGIKYVGEEMP